MRIDQLMSRQVRYCRPQDTLDVAARMMWENDCGSLPVCTDDGTPRVTGMVTDRDICMSALFEGKALHALAVATAMSEKVRTCRPDNTASEVEQAMSAARVRRLPVVDDAGSLVGIVSLADLALGPGGLEAGPAPEPADPSLVETLAAICEPDRSQPAA